MTDKATKGEWRYDANKITIEADGQLIALLNGRRDDEEFDANGRLMAASKDLAQSLQMLVEETSSVDVVRVNFARERAQAAPRKAGVL